MVVLQLNGVPVLKEELDMLLHPELHLYNVGRFVEAHRGKYL